MIDLSPVQPTQCMLHAKRLVDAWLDDPDSVDGWSCVVAQCKAYMNSTHCWLEHDGKAIDLTRSTKLRDRDRHYRRVGMVVGVQLNADSLLKEIWQAQWAWSGTGDVMDTVLYPLDAWVFRKYFHDHECDDMFSFAEAETETNR